MLYVVCSLRIVIESPSFGTPTPTNGATLPENVEADCPPIVPGDPLVPVCPEPELLAPNPPEVPPIELPNPPWVFVPPSELPPPNVDPPNPPDEEDPNPPPPGDEPP